MITQEMIDNMPAGKFDEDLLEFEEMASLDDGIDEEIEAGISLSENTQEDLVIDHMMDFDE